MVQTGLVNMAIGVGLAVLGIVVTAFSYGAVGSSGGHYVVTWGAVAMGAWRFVLGLIQIARGLSGEPTTPAGSGLTSSSVAVFGPTDGSSGAVGDLPTPMRVIGILLIAQGVVRLGFLVNLVLQIGSVLFTNGFYLLFSVVPSALLGVGGLIAGGLVLARSATARGFGVAFCIVSLLYQSYGLVTLILAMAKNPSYPLPLTTMVLIPANFAVCIAALVILARSSADQPRA